MKIKMYFGKLKTAMIVIVLLAALAIVALDIVMLVGTDTIKTPSPAVAGVSLAAAVLIAVAACLIFFNSFYLFEDESLRVVLGFFYDRMRYENVEAVKQNKETKEIYVIYRSESEEEGEQSIRLNLSVGKSEAFLEQMRKYCPFVIVEPFTPPEKKKKK